MPERDLAKEIVRAVEVGINRHLNRSIFYSPFRLFYNLFKKSNPNLIEQIREKVRSDIDTNLQTINGYNPAIFIDKGIITPSGKTLLQSCYDLGVFLLKKKLNVRAAFRIVRDSAFRNQIYNDLLNDIIKITGNLIAKQIEANLEPSQAIEG